MVRLISASVGVGGVNRPNDVTTIQEMLNKVPYTSGGPTPELVVDGLCGPKTKAAIQQFQLHHFGWSGADGRVDPGGPTHIKLHSFESFTTEKPPPPPPEKESSRWAIQRVGAKESFLGKPEEKFFRVLDMTNARAALYWFGNPSTFPPANPPPLTQMSAVSSFNSRGPHPISKLAGDCAYISHKPPGGRCDSCMVLHLPSGAIRIPMSHHLIGPDGITMGDGSTSLTGDFRFIRILFG